jgi:hypothetical protein
MMIYR